MGFVAEGPNADPVDQQQIANNALFGLHSAGAGVVKDGIQNELGAGSANVHRCPTSTGTSSSANPFSSGMDQQQLPSGFHASLGTGASGADVVKDAIQNVRGAGSAKEQVKTLVSGHLAPGPAKALGKRGVDLATYRVSDDFLWRLLANQDTPAVERQHAVGVLAHRGKLTAPSSLG